MNLNNPFPYSLSNKRYHTWDYHLKKQFGGKVFKVSLDGGFSCPNIDGTKGKGGCTYCAYSFRQQSTDDLRSQFRQGVEALHHKWPDAQQYIPYFQANTNTYAPVSELREKYEAVLAEPGVVGLSIATRADALPDDVLDYLEDLNRRTYLIVELGLQSAHDDTARRINRGHDYRTFLEGVQKLSDRGIPICVHIINGLPGETRERMVETVREISHLPLHCIKIHLLHVIKGTKLAEEFLQGNFLEMSLADYVETVCDQLELLPPEVVVQRVTGDGLRESLIAPLWSLKKLVVMNEIDKQLVRRNSWQGKYFK